MWLETKSELENDYMKIRHDYFKMKNIDHAFEHEKEWINSFD